MPETREVLSRIAALRHRLGQATAMASDAIANDSQVGMEPLEQTIERGEKTRIQLDRSLRRLGQKLELPGPVPQFTHRARRCLEHCRDVIDRLKIIHMESCLAASDDASPIVRCHRFCATMTEAAIRFAGALPDSVGAQVHLCEGLEGIIAAIGERMSRLETAVERQRRLTEQIDLLAFYLSSLASGRALAIDGFAAIAEVIERDVASGRPLEIISPEPISPAADAESAREWQARTAAMHSLTTAQVMARVLPNTRGIGETPLSSVIAALLLDVGMLRVPFEYVAQPGRLGPDQLRVIERHPILGAEIISSQMPTARAFCEVIRDHHERIDGTGYPAGTRIVGTIAQLVGAADHYSAMVAARPHRPPMDPHSAFMDLKLRQSRGSFGDAIIAGFDGLGVHPVGTGVVLANGCCGIVAASSSRGRQPVISLLISADGLLVPSPTTIEAGNEKSTTIVRSMPVTERSRRFGEHYPHLA